MKKCFNIARWIILVSSFLYIVFAIFATIMVGAAGHHTGVNESNLLVCFIMMLFVSFINKFKLLDNQLFRILNWITIGLVIWVVKNIICGAFSDYIKGEEVIFILIILIPFIVFSILIYGLLRSKIKH